MTEMAKMDWKVRRRHLKNTVIMTCFKKFVSKGFLQTGVVKPRYLKREAERKNSEKSVIENKFL